MGVWYGNSVFGVAPGRLLDMTSEFDVLRDMLILWPGPYLFVAKNLDGSKLLMYLL